jgi:hypothetical protein
METAGRAGGSGVKGDTSMAKEQQEVSHLWRVVGRELRALETLFVAVAEVTEWGVEGEDTIHILIESLRDAREQIQEHTEAGGSVRPRRRRSRRENLMKKRGQEYAEAALKDLGKRMDALDVMLQIFREVIDTGVRVNGLCTQAFQGEDDGVTAFMAGGRRWRLQMQREPVIKGEIYITDVGE